MDTRDFSALSRRTAPVATMSCVPRFIRMHHETALLNFARVATAREALIKSPPPQAEDLGEGFPPPPKDLQFPSFFKSGVRQPNGTPPLFACVAMRSISCTASSRAFALGGSLEQHAEQRFQQLFQRHHGQ